MHLINWTNTDHALNHEEMDETHQEFVSILNALHTAPDDAFPELFEHFYKHAEKHFAEENELMEKTRFPAFAEHRDEHIRILGEINQFQKRVKKGLMSFGRTYIRDSMPRWFSLHISTMDSALAAHLKQGR